MSKEKSTEHEELRYDTRLVGRHLRKGTLGSKDYDAYLKSLPDDEARSEPIEIRMEDEDSATPHLNGLTFTSG